MVEGLDTKAKCGLLLNHVSGRRDGIRHHHHKKMTSRINYNQPLKSVRTIRALKLEQYDRQKALDDPARFSDADLMHDAGVAFVWENAPGQSKVEQETIEASPIELKPPPQALAQALAPQPYSKSGDVSKSPPPVPAGTQTIGRSFHNLLDQSHRPSPPEATVNATSAALPTVRSQPNNGNHHQLPPKPQQSGDKPPQPRRTTTSAASVSQSGHHNSALLSRSGAHDHHQSARRTAKTRSSQELPVGQDRHHHSSRASTLHALTNDEVPLVTHSAPLLSDSNGGSLVVFSPDQGSNGAVASGSNGAASSHSGLLSRGSQDYLSARLRQSSAVLGVKDFYMSGRHTPLGSTVPNSSHATLPNSCMPTRPNSASASEAGSQSDEGDNQTDLGDTFSEMNTRDPDGRCQVSVLNGEQHESSSRHTDPHARDFIMERFLPAAKAMVTEAADVSERRSSQETPLVSPTRRNGRSPLLGRSRFAFKDQFSEEEEQEEVDQPDVLFKCKFPWQMGALRSTGPTDSGSAEQSPSPSFGNNKYSPSPTASIETRKGSSPRVFSDGQHDDSAWIYTESDGSARSTPKGDNACSFEERGLPPKSRNKNGIPIPRSQLYARETDSRDGNGSRGVIGEGANGECESEHLGRSNYSSFRASPGVPKDRLKETATQGNFDSRSGGNLGRRSPEPVYSGSLGTLLRTTQQQRRDLGRNSEAAIQAAVANVQEPIPPSSILNHHRNGPARAAAAAAAMAMTSNYGSKHSSTKPMYSGNGVNQDESNSYPRHLKVNLIRQQVAEPSGGSFDSLNDEVWESARESLVGSDHYDRPARVFTSNSSNLSESAHDFSNSSGWPLVKIQHLYARTPSSDSKDASFSSVSERSLRSPTNLALAIQQPSTEKYSPNSVLQPPLPKSPAESWLFKVRPPARPSTGTNWQASKPKKILDYSSPDDSMDVKWEALVKSENAQLRSKNVQEVPRKGTGLEKSEILGSKAR